MIRSLKAFSVIQRSAERLSAWLFLNEKPQEQPLDGLHPYRKCFSPRTPSSPHEREAGLTLIELIVTVAILGLLASAAVPIARWNVKRIKERELRADLWEMRRSIDAYKDAADKGGIQTKVDSDNYPPDLETLVKGIEVKGKKVRFLRRIPIDPMTGKADWGMRSEQDDPNSDSFGGQNLYDVYTKSQGTALNGTKYADW
jgi:general secretion pathway protein G